MMVRQALNRMIQGKLTTSGNESLSGEDVLQFFLERKSTPRSLSPESRSGCKFEFCVVRQAHHPEQSRRAEVGEVLLQPYWTAFHRSFSFV